MENKDLKFIDIHCHYDHLSKEALKKEFEKKEQISLTASVSFESYEQLEEIRKEKINGLFFAYGLYPDCVLKNTLDNCLEQVNKINFDNAIAVGEIGMDYKITKDKQKRKEQEILFLKQLEIAEKKDLLAVIHSRYATKKVLDILSTVNNKKILLHWFSGLNLELVRALDRGYYVTNRFAQPTILNIKDYLDQIFIETDYPVSYNSKPLEIYDIKKSYEVFCKEYSLDLNFVKEKIYSNFLKLFGKTNI